MNNLQDTSVSEIVLTDPYEGEGIEAVTVNGATLILFERMFNFSLN